MANTDMQSGLGRRERQIVETIHRLRRASVAEVRTSLPDPPTYSSVRAMLVALERKVYVRHERSGMKYLYMPAVSERRAQRSALKHLVSTFFGGSPVDAAAALLDISVGRLSNEEVDRLRNLIETAKKEGR